MRDKLKGNLQTILIQNLLKWIFSFWYVKGAAYIDTCNLIFFMLHKDKKISIFSMYFLGKWGIGYQKTFSVDRSLGIGGLTIQLKNTINGVCQVSYVTHGPIILKIFRHNLSYSDRAVFSFNLFIIFPFFCRQNFLETAG